MVIILSHYPKPVKIQVIKAHYGFFITQHCFKLCAPNMSAFENVSHLDEGKNDNFENGI